MIGLYGKGMHDFILMEAEVGTRTAMFQDAEDCDGAMMAYFFGTMTEEDFGPPVVGDLTDGVLDW